MYVILIGASPLGSEALTRLGVSYVLVKEANEHRTDVVGEPLGVFVRPYQSDPLSILDMPFGGKLAGVLSFTEHGLLPAALLSEALRLPTVSVAAVLRTRNKWLMRQSLAGGSQLKFGLLSREISAAFTPPVILKPVDGTASEDIHYVGDRSSIDLEALLRQRDCWLWEEYVKGTEYSVETVSYRKQHHILGITEKISSGPPHFVETGHVAPARLHAQDRENIQRAVFQCLDTLGIETTATHTELKYSQPDISIIEVQTRPGGGRIPRITQLVSGHNQHDWAIRSILQLEPPKLSPIHFQVARVHFFQWPTGRIARIEGVEKARALPGVLELHIDLPSDNTIRTWRSNKDRVGFAVIGGSTYDEVESRLSMLEEVIHLHYTE